MLRVDFLNLFRKEDNMETTKEMITDTFAVEDFSITENFDSSKKLSANAIAAKNKTKDDILQKFTVDLDSLNPVDENEVNSTTQRRISTLARKILTSDRSVRSDFRSPHDAIIVLRTILQNFYKISAEEFDMIYDAMWCHKAGLDYLVDKVILLADKKMSQECAYNRKRLVLRLCFPEYYSEHYRPLSDYELFFLKDSRVKSDLVVNSALSTAYINEFSVKKEKSVINSFDNLNNTFLTRKNSRAYRAYNNGTDIDQWIYKAFNNVWNTLFSSTTEELFVALARYKKNSLGSAAKCLDVVMKRGLYPSPLDWYMWNSPEEFQLEHMEEYLEVRRKTKLPPLKYLTAIEKALGNIKQKEQKQEQKQEQKSLKKIELSPCCAEPSPIEPIL